MDPEERAREEGTPRGTWQGALKDLEWNLRGMECSIKQARGYLKGS